MELNKQTSKRNFNSYLWHAVFASIAINFMDFDTVIPSMLLNAGGSAFQIGLLTSIMIGGAKISQLVTAPFLFSKNNKKPYLILGISIRFIMLFALSASFYYSANLDKNSIIYLIFIFISFFSFSEALASLPYTDILGKSIFQDRRKRFFSIKQVITSVLIFSTAFIVKKILGKYGFPENYALLFLLAGTFLTIASIGFWRIKEVHVPNIFSDHSFKEFLKLFKTELFSNKRLVYFLIIINTLGIGMAVLPFMVLFAKNNIGLESIQVGNLVILKTIGLVISGLLVFKYAKKLGYKTLLYIAIACGATIPIFGLLTKDLNLLFPFVFLMGGIYITAFSVSRSGILLEISTNSNRILYAGIAGFGSILITIFPLLAGLVIENWGFTTFFIMISVTISSSLFFVSRLECKQ